MKIKIFIIVIFSFMAFVSCKKQETMYYEGGELITFYRGRYDVDSTTYTFAFHPKPKERDTIYLNMRAQGAAQSRQRLIKVKAGVGTTAILGEDFLLPEIYLPADSFSVKYPVIILNSEKIKTKSLKIVAEVDASTDLVPGATGREIGGTYAMNSYKIWFSNKADKPAYWSRIEYYFGSFSVARLRFMISTLGISDFSVEAIGDYGLYNYPVTLRNAMKRYVEENKGPLIDEFGEIVNF
ncbi:DUF4843 domain-containing protein [Sphingobacterium psychroaquaticum]|uniref:Uncharacterized protein n=1 Tax=Sphingobacterium psychroaquaticum TaxID=561061 RepID=A0A1X7INE4_9SPHI|nr:DUF4843 domain-containing protein [Sphingobacterium psychroaquaticum]QBQ41384.1 DUF4843 domain-containing protein [Sphingobacterium psychroaquaticum]SMG16182.1 protein of unknown function [Sphingobacterium psychroaquaticum]